jgi:hypothetical protein
MPKSAKDQEDAGSVSKPLNSYPIPLYLNQKYVFSILAIMEGGFSQFESVKATRTEQEDKSNKVSGQAGVSNAFGFFGITLGGERAHQRQTGDIKEVTSERVHTPDSLFARMRERLYEQGKIQVANVDDWKPGDFVEFKATLRKNPLVETFETILAVGRTFGDLEEPRQNKSGKNTNARHSNEQSTPNPANISNQLKQVEVLLRMIKGMDEGGSLDLIGSLVDAEDVQAVLVVDPSFSSDPTLADLVDGEYSIIGKVVKVIPKGSNNSINLLRKTTIGMLPDLAEKLVANMSTLEGMRTTQKELTTSIEGPAIQVVPIAIFL